MLRLTFLTIFLLLNACGDGANAPGPGGVSADDAEALDRAAEKLDAEAANPDR